MKTHSETLQLPFGSAILRVTTNGAIIASHEFTELPLERVFEGLGEEHMVAACFLGGLRVHLDPGELLLTDMEIDVGEDWEGEQSYGMNCTTLSA